MLQKFGVSLVLALACMQLLVRGDWEEVEEALFLQQAKRVTRANLSIIVESWSGSPGAVDGVDSSPSLCLVHSHVMRVIQSWNAVELIYRNRRGDSCGNVDAIPANFDPDVCIRIGRKFATEKSVVRNELTVPEFQGQGRLLNVLLLRYSDIKMMTEKNSTYVMKTNRREFGTVEQVLVFSDSAKRDGSSGRGTRSLVSLFSHLDKNAPPPALGLLSEPKTGEEEQITSALNTSLLSGVLNSQFYRHVAANLNAMRSQLSWSASLAVQSRRRGPSARRPLKAVAIIVEPRIVPSFEFSVRNVLHHLLRSPLSNIQWKLHVYSSPGPAGNEHFVKSVLSDMPPSLIKFIRLPRTFDRDGGGGYNQLLKSSSFWRRLMTYGFSTALVFQADSILVDTSRLGEFFAYDFIGAPWMTKETRDKSRTMVPSEESPLVHLQCCNGGLSLRHVKSMYRIASEKRSLNPDVNEDVYFSTYVEEFKLRTPGILQASNFSLEKPPSRLLGGGLLNDGASTFTPSGLHAAWAYNDQAFIEKLLQVSCDNLNINCTHTV